MSNKPQCRPVDPSIGGVQCQMCGCSLNVGAYPKFAIAKAWWDKWWNPNDSSLTQQNLCAYFLVRSHHYDGSACDPEFLKKSPTRVLCLYHMNMILMAPVKVTPEYVLCDSKTGEVISKHERKRVG